MASPFAQQIEKWQGYANQGDAEIYQEPLCVQRCRALYRRPYYYGPRMRSAADLQNHFWDDRPMQI